MKKFVLSILLILCIILSGFASNIRPALYSARLNNDAWLKAQPDKDMGAIAFLFKNDKIEILELLPDWLLIRTKNGNSGYIKRKYINFDRVKPVNPSTTPQYPAIISEYVSWVETLTSLRASPDLSAKAIITLNPGARLAIIGLENGWAKLIYQRQYAYVDSRHLSELMPLAQTSQIIDRHSPIAAFTSFYRLSADRNNKNRMSNISVANDRMRPLIIKPNEAFDFNRDVGPYTAESGYLLSIGLADGETKLGYGGGTCQVSSTLFNSLLQLPGISIEHRRTHGFNGSSYLPIHADAAVGNPSINLIFRNLYSFPIRIDGTAQDGALTILIWPA